MRNNGPWVDGEEVPDMRKQQRSTQLLSEVHIEIYLSWVTLHHQHQIFDQKQNIRNPIKGKPATRTRARTNHYGHECSSEHPSTLTRSAAHGCVSPHPTRMPRLRGVESGGGSGLPVAFFAGKKTGLGRSKGGGRRRDRERLRSRCEPAADLFGVSGCFSWAEVRGMWNRFLGWAFTTRPSLPAAKARMISSPRVGFNRYGTILPIYRYVIQSCMKRFISRTYRIGWDENGGRFPALL